MPLIQLRSNNLLDPFEDGSLIKSWSFEDTLLNDQASESWLLSPTDFQAGQLSPATGKVWHSFFGTTTPETQILDIIDFTVADDWSILFVALSDSATASTVTFYMGASLFTIEITSTSISFQGFSTTVSTTPSHQIAIRGSGIGKVSCCVDGIEIYASINASPSVATIQSFSQVTLTKPSGDLKIDEFLVFDKTVSDIELLQLFEGKFERIFYPRNLDPFGDSSLVDSWVFTELATEAFTLNNQKVDNPLIPDAGHTPTVAVNNYNGINDVNAFSTNDQTLVGEVSATFCAWMDCGVGKAVRISFGEDGQRYNVELDTFEVLGSTKVSMYLHKVGDIVQTSTSAGWHHLTAVIEAGGTNSFYLDGVLVNTVPLVMKFLANRTQVSVTTSNATDIMYFDRVLTVAEINQIKDNTFPALPTLRTLDPFYDGSLVESFMFENSFGNDQSTRILSDTLNMSFSPMQTYDRTGLAYSTLATSIMLPTLNVTGTSFAISFIMDRHTTNSGWGYWEFGGSTKLQIVRNSGETEVFINGVSAYSELTYDYEICMCISSNGTEVFIAIDSILVHTYTGSLDLTGATFQHYITSAVTIFYTDELLFFNRALTSEETRFVSNRFESLSTPITVLADSILLTTTSLEHKIFSCSDYVNQVRTLDPFGDGSLKHSFSFENVYCSEQHSLLLSNAIMNDSSFATHNGDTALIMNSPVALTNTDMLVEELADVDMANFSMSFKLTIDDLVSSNYGAGVTIKSSDLSLMFSVTLYMGDLEVFNPSSGNVQIGLAVDYGSVFAVTFDGVTGRYYGTLADGTPLELYSFTPNYSPTNTLFKTISVYNSHTLGL